MKSDKIIISQELEHYFVIYISTATTIATEWKNKMKFMSEFSIESEEVYNLNGRQPKLKRFTHVNAHDTEFWSYELYFPRIL